MKSGVVCEKGTTFALLTRAVSISEECFTRGTEFIPERWEFRRGGDFYFVCPGVSHQICVPYFAYVEGLLQTSSFTDQVTCIQVCTTPTWSLRFVRGARDFDGEGGSVGPDYFQRVNAVRAVSRA